jgi:hypothetical protein
LETIVINLSCTYGDAAYWSWFYKNTFSYRRLDDLDIRVHFWDQHWVDFFDGFFRSVTPSYHPEVGWSGQATEMPLEKLRVGCAPLAEPDPNGGLLLSRKKLPPSFYCESQDSEFRLYPFEMYREIAELLIPQYSSVTEFGDNHIPGIPALMAKDFLDAISIMRKAAYGFVDISFPLALASCCNTPFISLETFSPYYTLGGAANLIFDLSIARVVFRRLLPFPLSYFRQRPVILEAFNQAREAQQKRIAALEQTAPNVRYQLPDGLRKEFRESPYDNLPPFEDSPDPGDSTFCYVEDDLHHLLRALMMYTHQIRNVNYLCRKYRRIKFSDGFGRVSKSFVESQVPGSEGSYVYQLSYTGRPSENVLMV